MYIQWYKNETYTQRCDADPTLISTNIGWTFCILSLQYALQHKYMQDVYPMVAW